MKNKLTYISLFSSAGVGCYGFKKEGFECIATNELLNNRLDIQKYNNKCKYNTGYISGDITSTEIKNKLFAEIDKWKENEKLKDVDVIIATPPCQGMSSANYKKNNEQKRNSLVVEAIKIIKEIKSKIFIFENVRAFMKTICTDIDGEDKLISESIYNNLSKDYNIFYKVINFKDYGVPSSRPRTIVIGTRKDLVNIAPLNLFPEKRDEITLRDAIGDLPELKYGEISKNDVYHFARKYPKYMQEWITDLKEGQSAFENEENKKPYRIVNGKKIVQKSAHLGNKYRRLYWDKCGACIATRSDQLAALDTIHPQDDRVLSIRELMRLMTIPDDFKWTNDDLGKIKDKEEFLKDNELNIRRCIGEAVPTYIMQRIAQNIKEMMEYQTFVDEYKKEKLTLYEKESKFINNFYIQSFIYEELLSEKKKTGSFYTPQSVVFNAIKTYKCDKNIVKVLEPAVGLGAFIPQLASLLDNCQTIEMDVIDINQKVLDKLKSIINLLKIKNIKINYICDDFITHNINEKYDLIVTNPPYFKPDSNIIKKYRKITNDAIADNIFIFFMEKIKKLTDEIILIIPKTFLMSPEYKNCRSLYEQMPIVAINDFGVKFFKKVFVEIISVHFKLQYKENLVVEDFVNNKKYILEQKYIIHDTEWLIYRNQWFDNFIKKMKLNVFEFYRDRAVTNKYLKNSGKYRVLKSKNILDNGEIINIEGYDKYIDEIDMFNIKKYVNSNSIIMPNFTYNTRASLLPDNTIANGSIAILTPKNIEDIKNINLKFYSTEEFRNYYSIVKNKSKFTINIDASSIYYIGVEKNE